MPQIAAPTLEPFIKLAQSNSALFTDFMMSPGLMWQPGPAPSGEPGASRAAAPDAMGRLVKGMVENYVRFLFELSQSTMQAWGQAQRTATASADAAVNTP